MINWSKTSIIVASLFSIYCICYWVFIMPSLPEPDSWKITMDTQITFVEWDKNTTTTTIHFDNGVNVTLIGDMKQLQIYGNGTITPNPDFICRGGG